MNIKFYYTILNFDINSHAGGLSFRWLKAVKSILWEKV